MNALKDDTFYTRSNLKKKTGINILIMQIQSPVFLYSAL